MNFSMLRASIVVAALAGTAAAALRLDATQPWPVDAPTEHGGGRDVRLRTGDKLRIIFFDVEGPSVKTVREVQVDRGGNILLPPDGMPVRAAGRTARELEIAIRKAYGDANLIQNLEVRVERIPSEPTTRPAP